MGGEGDLKAAPGGARARRTGLTLTLTLTLTPTQHWPMRRERWSVRSTLCRRGMPRIVRLHGFRRSREGLSRGIFDIGYAYNFTCYS